VSEDVFKLLRLVVWALPAAIAYNTWGPQVALLTFGCQMFSVGPLTKMYAMFKARTAPVEIADVRKFYLMINIVAGAGYAYLVHALIGGAPPGPLPGLGG